MTFNLPAQYAGYQPTLVAFNVGDPAGNFGLPSIPAEAIQVATLTTCQGSADVGTQAASPGIAAQLVIDDGYMVPIVGPGWQNSSNYAGLDAVATEENLMQAASGMCVGMRAELTYAPAPVSSLPARFRLQVKSGGYQGTVVTYAWNAATSEYLPQGGTSEVYWNTSQGNAIDYLTVAAIVAGGVAGAISAAAAASSGAAAGAAGSLAPDVAAGVTGAGGSTAAVAAPVAAGGAAAGGASLTAGGAISALPAAGALVRAVTGGLPAAQPGVLIPPQAQPVVVNVAAPANPVQTAVNAVGGALSRFDQAAPIFPGIPNSTLALGGLVLGLFLLIRR